MTIKFFCRVYSASSACIRKTFLFHFILFNGFLVVADQSIYVGSSVDPPTSQNFAISHESSSDIKNSSIKSLEKISMSQEMTTEMSKSYDTSLNSPEKNEICLDVMVLTSTEEKTAMSPNEDVLENIENLKKKKDCSSVNTVCKEKYTDCVPITFESNDSLSGASVESTLPKGECHVQNRLEYSCCKVESISCIQESIPTIKQTKNAILQKVMFNYFNFKSL